MIELTPPRKDYVFRFFKKLGFQPDNLSLDDLIFVFDRLARVEEYVTPRKYKGQNWEITFAPLERQEEYFNPVIEQKIQLWLKNGEISRIPGAPPLWPQNKQFCLCLTHDVDQIQEYRWRERLRQLRFFSKTSIRAMAPVIGSLIKHLGRQVFRSRPLKTSSLEHWLEAEARYGFSSSFLFIADQIPSPTISDIHYRYDEKVDFEGRRIKVSQLIKELWKLGWDVGLHGSRNSHISSTLLKYEKKSLEEILGARVVSIRQHYLCCDVEKTPRAQDDAGFRIDSTFGSNLQVGFRCGIGLPYPFYDLKTDNELNLLELPMVIQDMALARNTGGYQELMTQRCIEMIDRVASVNGAITLLWHNAWPPDSAGYRCYKKILEAAAARGAWGCSMRALDEWWRERNASMNHVCIK